MGSSVMVLSSDNLSWCHNVVLLGVPLVTEELRVHPLVRGVPVPLWLLDTVTVSLLVLVVVGVVLGL